MEESHKSEDDKIETTEHLEHHEPREHHEVHHSHINNNSKKERIKTWLKDPYNLSLVGILILAFVIRLYYFWITKNQTLWWDELVFGDIAKNFVYHNMGGLSFIKNEMVIRPPLLSLTWAVLIFIKVSESIIKFIMEILPSVLSVFFVYLLGKEFYNKKIALIAAFILALSWIHIFYSVRILTSIPALLFSLISIYYFYKSQIETSINLRSFLISILCLSIAILIRYNFVIVGIAYFLFLIFIKKIDFLKDKNFWIGGIIGAIPLLILLIINFIKSGSILPVLSPYSAAASSTISYAFYTLNFIPHILQFPFFILFLIGLIFVLGRLAFGFGFIKKSKNLRADIFFTIILCLNLIFLIFIMKYSEDRYLFECLISIIFLVSIGIDAISNFVIKYNRVLSIFLIVGLLLIGGYSQYKFGDNMIKSKSTTYAEMKEAFLWIKDNTPKGSSILGSGIYPYVYYSDRVPIEFSENQSVNESFKNADYFILHSFSPQPQGLVNFASNQVPEKVFFFDKSNTQPAVIIYKINKN